MRAITVVLAVAVLLPAMATGAQTPAEISTAELARRIRIIESHPEGIELPPADRIARGTRLIPAGTRVAGPVAAIGGALEVYGEIEGDVIAIDGDVVVHEGGVVTGDALSIGGTVRAERGIVRGEMRSISEITPIVGGPAALSPWEATKRALGIAVGSLAILAIIGIGVLMFAGSYLDEITIALEQRFARAFWVGILGQLAMFPLLIVVVIGLAITIIGILLIPFAIVAYVLAAAGIFSLGFLAMARVTGAALVRRRGSTRASARTATLWSLMLGLLVFFGVWIVAAAVTWMPVAGGILRGLAAVLTWVAVTAGFGATILTRVGTRRVAAELDEPMPTDEMSWQTPTPVTGVAAARRPTPMANRIPDR